MSRRHYNRERHFLLLNCCGSKRKVKTRFSKFLHQLFLLIVLSLVLAPLNISAKTCDEWVAKAVSVEGRVEAKRAGETQWQQVQSDETFCAGDQVRVMDKSRADLAFANQPLLRLDQNSTITLAGIEEESSGLAGLFKGAAKLDLIEGAAHFFSRLPRNLEVRTGFVNAGVEGTEFFIKVADNKTFISVFEGKVLAANESGNLSLTSGQSAVAEAGKAPVLQVVARPRDAVHWALYYPPVLDGPGSDSLVNEAAQLLAVGRVDEAGSKIKQALGVDPANSNALSLQAIIAVVQNEKGEALNLADKAVAAGPNSATALIARSYAQQANFDLEAARKSLEEAVRLKPENALAWARLAELQSSFGELDKALDAARKAVELNPNLSRTQTVLGFVYLIQIKTIEARAAFNRAIEQDQADSLPRLGLGLAKIRDGELEDGRREIEIAASLDSNSSIIRSYLGKAYYEEKRPELDGREYAIAKELDPKDPTPWFYDAIRKQTINQPVEALHDLQTAIGLNDNRAVYRSKLMLDSDLAARSASLARIYSDLGFQQRALVEGYNSVNADPTNYSAHRFLADSYSALPRHEIARVSELLQSQLLQPTNITPIQPQLAESNLFLINAGGAVQASFSEFNPLFNSNQTALLASGVLGEDSTIGGEAVVSGIHKKVSFSVGYSHFDTDGWRVNNDQQDDIANAFLQLELTPKTSFQGEYRYRNIEKGDLQLRFFPTDIRPNERQESESNSFRIGFRHSFSPSSIIIGNLMRQDVDSSLADQPANPMISSIDINTDEKATSFEIQHLFRSERINTASGIGYFDINGEDLATTELDFPPPPMGPGPITDVQNIDRDVKHTNAYIYTYINLLKNVTATIGVSGDFIESERTTQSILDDDQINPKAGIIWNPFSNTTVRAAAFKVMKRTLITDQTLEPTQVAGFNQFFDDASGEISRRYGGAIDQKFSNNLYGGIEYSVRDREVPYWDTPPPPDPITPPPPPSWKKADWNEALGRLYIFFTPSDWLALSAEYQYEKIERELQFTFDGVNELKTHKIPLGIKLFHPSGLSASLKGTYFNQDGIIQPEGGPFESVEETFWVVDGSISYRLPKRYGFLSAGVTNLFDEDFRYQDTDPDNPTLRPARLFFAKLTLAMP